MTYNNKLNLVKSKALKLGAEDLKPSTRKNKKYMVLYNNKWIHFGSKGMSDFIEHKDKDRRMRYQARASKIKDKNNNFTFKLKSSPNFWSYYVLW